MRRRFERESAPDFDGLEAVGYCDCTACCYAAGDEGAVREALVYSIWCGDLEMSTYPRVVDIVKLYATTARAGRKSALVREMYSTVTMTCVTAQPWIEEDWGM